MVSVNEKYFIEKLACENVKNNSPQKFVNSKVSRSPNDSLNYQTPYHSKVNKYKTSSLKWEHHGEFDYEDKGRNGRSELNPERHSDVSFTSNYSNGIEPQKRIVWHNRVIDKINNILSKSDLNSSVSSSNNESLNYFIEDIEKTVEHFNELPGDNLYWDQSSSLPRERNLHQMCRMNKKRFYSRNDDKGLFKKSKIKNFSIQPLDANWKYCNVDYYEIVTKIQERTIELKDWVRIHQPKISLLGDSHTRHLADIITEMLPGFKIEASVKPGAKSKEVLSSLKDVLFYMGENDFVVILSGTNDMWIENLEEPKGVVYNAVMDARCTNLLLCNVPNNYLEPSDSAVQDNIINFNQFYQDVVNFSKWAHLVNLQQLKDRRFFTRHGLHFNLYGKIKICDLVSNKILDIIDLIKR